MSTPAYRYKLSVDGQDYLFCDISGLEIGFDVVGYQESAGDVIPMLGPRKPAVVSLRRGSADGYKALYDWISLQSHASPKKDVTLALLDEDLSPSTTWSIIDAFPSSLTSLVYTDGLDQPVIGELVLQGLRVTAQFQA
ncbi:phage tail protein [Kitasatospora sp. NPDC101447]|uniref:phage tail protein n=1 Tax=Kitasatospora sp. NPDC101447 TaxID=3364102 RepID=UPI0038281265